MQNLQQISFPHRAVDVYCKCIEKGKRGERMAGDIVDRIVKALLISPLVSLLAG